MKNIHELVNKLGLLCKNNHYTLVTVESCTGGSLASAIASNYKASCILERGYVVYSPTSKEDILDISAYQLQTNGLVSQAIAKEMAEKGLEKSRAQICIAITGVEESKTDPSKPGVVWIACAGIHRKTVTKRFRIKGNRDKFTHQILLLALQIILDFVNKA